MSEETIDYGQVAWNGAFDRAGAGEGGPGIRSLSFAGLSRCVASIAITDTWAMTNKSRVQVDDVLEEALRYVVSGRQGVSQSAEEKPSADYFLIALLPRRKEKITVPWILVPSFRKQATLS